MRALVVSGGVAAAAAAAWLLLKRRSAESPPPPASKADEEAPAAFEAGALASSPSMSLCGTMLLCTQNLAVSGANQVVLNLCEGGVWPGNIVLLSPSAGPFAKEFAALGIAVFIGELPDLLERVRDVRVAICNTIMTAHIVLALHEAKIPCAWVLHEWWPSGQLEEELTKRNDKNTNAAVVAEALDVCPRVVSVCEAQRQLYNPRNGFVNFVGVPEPAPLWKAGAEPPSSRPITLLCLGIVCPRKNQHWAVEAFRDFAGDRTDVRLIVVGARYTRQYEKDYVEKVKYAARGDSRIEVHDVTSDVDAFYRKADILLFTSLNEVTPMVIAESMMRSIPVITTNIAGIPEMLEHKVHGYVLPPEKPAFVEAMQAMCEPGPRGQQTRLQMGAAGKRHALATFTNAAMCERYRAASLALSPPVVLLDMDGVVVDWDAGFLAAWGGTSPVQRSDYSMEKCVPPDKLGAATALFHSKGFFANLPPMAGSVAAVKRMVALGYQVFFCTSPVLTSRYCAGEKYEWIIKHFGQDYARRVIITTDKTSVRGDILIDDKPDIKGSHHPTWRQLVFDAPYNRAVKGPRLASWDGWEAGLRAALANASEDAPAPAPAAVTAESVSQLPDFSYLLPEDYRADYLAWRAGEAHGAKGEAFEVAAQVAAKQDVALNLEADDFTEVSVYRSGYANWRRGGVSGAKTIDLKRK